MENFDDTLNQMKDSSGEMSDNMHILNEIVPIEEQMKYFEYSKQIQNNRASNTLDKNFLIAKLFTPDIDIEDKKYYLVLLAGIVDTAAYRALESYHKNPLEPELVKWSALALTESKILLDSEFSGKKQFFVSTGLGGLNKKLRYFIVIATEDRSIFTKFQKEVLLRELNFQFKQDDVELESIEERGNYLKLFILCGLKHDPRICIEKAIDETNELGHFIDKQFLLTNVKQIDDHAIERLLTHQHE